jgi:hypothetical protein
MLKRTSTVDLLPSPSGRRAGDEGADRKHRKSKTKTVVSVPQCGVSHNHYVLRIVSVRRPRAHIQNPYHSSCSLTIGALSLVFSPPFIFTRL